MCGRIYEKREKKTNGPEANLENIYFTEHNFGEKWDLRYLYICEIIFISLNNTIEFNMA